MRNLVGMTLMVALLACNADLKVHTSGGALDEMNPAGDPTADDPSANGPEPEFAGEFAFEHAYVQSRSAISLQLSSELLRAGERFTLWNETTETKLIDDEQASFALVDGSALHLAGGYALYRFVPAGYSSVFAYGVNNLRLGVNDAVAPRYATGSLVLRDFPIFELGLTHFGENVQTKGNFQGWVNSVAQPTVSAQGTTLTVGMPNIVNR